MAFINYFLKTEWRGQNKGVTFRLPSCYLSALNNSDASTEKEVASARASPINLSTRRSTSPRFSEPQEQEQQHSNNESIDIEGMDTMSQPSSPPLSSTNVTPTKKSSSLSPRKHAPYRLDKAVRKLTDRLEASKDGVCSRRSSPLQQPKSEYLNTTEFIGETSNNVSTENEKPVNGTVSTPSTMPFLSQPNLNGAVDPFAFIMLRNLANASKQSSKNSAIKRLVFFIEFYLTNFFPNFLFFTFIFLGFCKNLGFIFFFLPSWNQQDDAVLYWWRRPDKPLPHLSLSHIFFKTFEIWGGGIEGNWGKEI